MLTISKAMLFAVGSQSKMIQRKGLYDDDADGDDDDETR